MKTSELSSDRQATVRENAISTNPSVYDRCTIKPSIRTFQNFWSFVKSISCSACNAQSESESHPHRQLNCLGFHLVKNLQISVYLWCTLRLGEHQRIAYPRAPHVGLKLLLPCPHPR